MAVTWGDWESGPNNSRARLGVEIIGNVDVTANFWIETNGFVDDEATLNVFAPFRDVVPIAVSLAGAGTKKIWTANKTFTQQYGETSAVSVTASLVSFAIGTPMATGTFTVPALPYQPPAAPTGVSARRLVDGRVDITWGGAPTTAAPISGFAVQRNRKWSTGYEGWEHITTLSATSRSYLDGTLEPDMAYKYRVRAEGPGGQSAFVETGEVYTTPAAPGSASARRDGADIIVSAVHRSRFPSNIEVWEGDTHHGNIATGYTTLRIVGADPMVPHTYKVRAVLSGLYSRWVFIYPVGVAVAPYAPDGLYPNGGWQLAGHPVTLGWVHNPADNSAQTSYQLRYRKTGTSTWTTLSRTYTTEEERAVTFPTTWDAAEWQVMTWGQDAGKPGAWSNIASFGLAAKPTFTIVSPTPGQIVETETLTIVLSTPVVDGLWEIEILKNGVLVDSARGAGGGTIEWTVHELQNLDDLIVRARVADKLWADWQEVAFEVRYAAPPEPEVSPRWEPGNASMNVEIVNDLTGTVPAVSARLYRRVDGGTWELLLETTEPVTTVKDPLPPLNGHVEYRAVAVSGIGTTSASAPVSPDGEAPPCAYYLNWGAGWGETARVRYNPDRAITTGLAYQEFYHFAGQSKPTAHAGIGTSETSRISGTLTPTDKAVDHVLLANRLADLGKTPGVRVSLRSPDRRTVFGSVTGVTISQGEAGRYTVELTHIESD